MKGCLDTANTWEHAWWRSINMTPQTVEDEHWALVWFAPPHYSSLKTCMVHLTQSYWAQLVVMLPLRETCQELLMKFLRQLAASVASPHADCWVWWFLQDWTTAAGLCLVFAWCLPAKRTGRSVAASSHIVSAYLKDWSAASESYLVFAIGLECFQRRAYPQGTIAVQVHFPCILITFLIHNFCWVVG